MEFTPTNSLSSKRWWLRWMLSSKKTDKGSFRPFNFYRNNQYTQPHSASYGLARRRKKNTVDCRCTIFAERRWRNAVPSEGTYFDFIVFFLPVRPCPKYCVHIAHCTKCTYIVIISIQLYTIHALYHISHVVQPTAVSSKVKAQYALSLKKNQNSTSHSNICVVCSEIVSLITGGATQ